MPKLVINDGEGTREVGLKSGDTLGRTSQNAVQLKVAEASRNHCRFTEEKGSWFIEDLGSSNGTQVNGRKVTKFELQDGDVVSVGKATLRFLDAPLEAEVEAQASSSGSWGEDDLSLEDKIFLVIGGANRRGEVVPVPEGRISVGRNAKHALILKDASVSGDHAEIRREGSTCAIKDLGSSNGTFVNDRRLPERGEAELASGDVVRFGLIACAFGVGDPADFAPPGPEEVSGGSGDTFTKAMESPAGLLEESQFEVHETAPAAKDTLWNVVSLLAILGLAGGAGWLWMQGQKEAGGGGGRSLERGSNLLPEGLWSFELPDLPQGSESGPAPGGPAMVWEKEDLADPADVGEVSDPRRSGHLAYRINRAAAAAPPTFAVLDAPLPVSSGQVWRLSAHVQGDGAAPVLAALWYEERREDDETVLAEITRDLVVGPIPGRSWSEVSGIVASPEGASHLRVAVGALGGGSVVFDDVVLVAVPPPEGMVREVKEFRAVLEAHGTLRLSRYGRRLIEGLGPAPKEGERILRPEEVVIADPAVPPGGEVQASLRGGQGALRIALEGADDRFTLRYAGPGLGAAARLEAPLVPREGAEIQVTLLDGETGRRYGQAFPPAPGTALIVGSGSDRAKLHFQDASGQPVRLPVSYETAGRRNVVVLDVSGRADLAIGFQLSFQKEEQDARDLLARARDAARNRQGGTALRSCEEIMSRFPFEAQVVDEAAKIQAQVLDEARIRVAALRARLDDAIFFRDLAREAKLVGEIAEEKARFGDTAPGAEIDKLAADAAAAVHAWEQPLREAQAGRLLARGQDFLDGGRAPLATLMFRTVVSAFAGSDEAEQAAGFLKRIGNEKDSGPKER